MKHTRAEIIEKEYLEYLENENVELIKKQIIRQHRSIDEGIKSFTKKEENNFSNSSISNVLMNRLIGKYIEGIKKFIEDKQSNRLSYIKKFITEELEYFKENEKGRIDYKTPMVSINEIAYISLYNILSSANNENTNLVKLCKTITKEITIQKRDNIIKTEKKGLYKVLEKNTRTQNVFKRYQNNILRAEQLIEKKEGEEQLINKPSVYNEDENYKLGLKLVEIFMEETGYIEKYNKLVKTGNNSKTVSCIKFKEEVLEKIEVLKTNISELHPIKKAMIIRPKDWTNLTNGGYLKEITIKEVFDKFEDGKTNFSLLDELFIRTRNKKAIKHINEYANLDEVYDCINSIQSVEWVINKKVFGFYDYLITNNIQFESEKKGIILRKICPLDLPIKLDENETNKDIILKYRKEASKIHDENKDTLSERITIGIKHNILKDLNSLEKFYFCWNVDYRGRIYPIQKLVNPQMDDSIKGCLKFKNGKELGKNGLYWLKVHCANLNGVDKVNFDDRVKWVDENIEQLIKIGKNPIENLYELANIDKPFQFLAVIQEITEALELKDCSKYISYISVALDGSNSGLQHWSAMLRDEDAAKSVNVLYSEKPSDVYKDVADKVIVLLEEDLKNGINTTFAELWLNSNEVNRSLCKRPTMTTPYAVKSFGIMDQIIDYLKKENKAEELYSTKGSVVYIRSKIEEALEKTIISAKVGMNYLQEITKSVVKKYNSNMYWTTPTGFIVYQDYFKSDKVRINTFFGGCRFSPQFLVKNDKVSLSKSCNGIAPNFIHSYDAAHLVKVCNTMFSRFKINSLWLIHDSFATYACDTDLLHRTLIEEFVELYKEDRIEQFKVEINNNFPELEFPETPKKGKMDIYDVYKSKFIFS